METLPAAAHADTVYLIEGPCRLTGSVPVSGAKNAALPLAQTDKIVMYGDGNPTRMVRDVMNSSGQIIEGLKEATGIDLTALLSAYAAGKQGAQAQQAEE